MRILIIDEEFPYPLNTGKRIRTYNLVRELARYNDISYLAFGSSDSESYTRLDRDGLGPIAVPPPDRKQSGPFFYARLLMNLFSPWPYIVTSHYTGSFQRRLRELVRRHRYDLLICEWTPYARYLKDLDGVRSIIVAHNIESSIWARYQQNETNPVKRWYISIQKDKIVRFEKSCFHWTDGATAVSAEEAAFMNSLDVPYPTEVIENGVDVDYFAPRDDEVVPSQLVFTGSMDWRPNQDACLYLVDEILPLLREAKHDVRVLLVGRKPPRHIRALGERAGVTVTGSVDDVRPYISRSAVCLVPLRIGGGSRLKILEAMAMKKPVVSTSVGSEGLQVSDGENIVNADTPETFASAVVGLLEDPSRRERIAAAGYDLVHRKYRWEELGKKYDRYINTVAGRP